MTLQRLVRNDNFLESYRSWQLSPICSLLRLGKSFSIYAPCFVWGNSYPCMLPPSFEEILFHVYSLLRLRGIRFQLLDIYFKCIHTVSRVKPRYIKFYYLWRYDLIKKYCIPRWLTIYSCTPFYLHS